jgi:hypothetical protein
MCAGDFLDVCAAEIIAKYFIRGTAVSTDRPSHNNNICRDLNLTVNAHAHRSSRESLFGRVGKEFRISTGGTACTLTLENDLIHFYPLHSVSNLTDLECIPSILGFRQLGQLCDLDRYPDRTLSLCKMFFDVIIYSTLRFFNAATTNLCAAGTTRLTFAYFYARTKAVSSYEFCDWIFNVKTQNFGGHTGLFWVRSNIETMVGSSYDSWKSKFTKYLNDSLQTEKNSLLFPYPNQAMSFVVFPLFRGSSSSLLKTYDIVGHVYGLRFRYDSLNESAARTLSLIISIASFKRLKEVKCWDKIFVEVKGQSDSATPNHTAFVKLLKI